MNILIRKLRSFPRWVGYKYAQSKEYRQMIRDLRSIGMKGVGTTRITLASGHVLTVKTGYYETLMLWENQYKKIYEKYLNFKPKVIIDLGAHKGFFSVRMAERFPDAKIYAVEASSENYRYLLENTTQFENIKPIHAAAWNEKTVLSLSLSADHLNSLVKGGAKKTEQIATITLQEMPQADFIKCDIEGAEKVIPFNAREYVALEVEEDQGLEVLDYLREHYQTVYYELPIAYALHKLAD